MKIGFIDHHLHNWHSDVFVQILRGMAGENMEVCCAYESHPAEGMDDWCAVNNVAKATSPEEVVAMSDAIFVQAPDNIGDHLALGRAAYMSGKPVYVDKYLSTSLADAKEIVALCAASGAKLMSASSLRFFDGLMELLPQITEQPKEVFARGFGHWYPYSVHTTAAALALFGDKADRLINTGTHDAANVTIADGNRRCTVQVYWAPDNHHQAMPWQVSAIQDNKILTAQVIDHETVYGNLMAEVVKFLKSGVSPVSTDEMLLTCAIDELGVKSLDLGGVWLPIE